jgi:hypothetical protein
MPTPRNTRKIVARFLQRSSRRYFLSVSAEGSESMIPPPLPNAIICMEQTLCQAFSQSPLSPASRSFTKLILKGSKGSNLPVPRLRREGLQSALPRLYRVFWGRSLHRTDSGHLTWQWEPLFAPRLALTTRLAHSSGRSSTSPTTGGRAKSPLMQISPAVSGAS